MERFRGILICTTNRLKGLDPASLRRFQVKARFDYLSAAGKALLYQRVLAPLCLSPVGRSTLAALAEIGPLAPGDFRVALDRFRLEPPGGHAELVAALQQESELRAEQQGGRPVGFNAAL
jgi:hypothetical protein